MKIDILTLFPQMVDDALSESMIGRGRAAGLLQVTCHNIRDYTLERTGRTDDYPYGGGLGMVMQCEPLFRCLEAVKNGRKVHTVLMSPRGSVFDQQKAKELLGKEEIILICGHYEGVDQRFIDCCVDEELSLGDFVLTGGELAAACITDAVGRMAPGVLAEQQSFEEESHYSGLLEYPQYTRPEVWRENPVPPVLLSGDHEIIRRWRRREALLVTGKVRPDLLKKAQLTYEDMQLLEEQESTRKHRPGTRRLETSRLLLRPFISADAEDAFEGLFGAWDVMRMSGIPRLESEKETADLLKSWEREYKNPRFFRWAVTQKKDDQPIGMLFLEPAGDDSVGQLFFALAEPWRRRGLMTEAVREAVSFAFKKAGFRRIQAMHDAAESNPGGVLRRAGLMYEGLARQLKNVDGKAIDCHLYGITQRDFLN